MQIDEYEGSDIIDLVARGGRFAMETGIPQQIVQHGGNMATSFVQASGQNALYASILATLVATAGRKVGAFSDNEAKVIKVAAAAYVVKELATRTGGIVPGTSKTTSLSTVYDVPDVMGPRLPPRPPLEPPLEIEIPVFRRGRSSRPSPQPAPSEITDPALRRSLEPVTEPLFLPEPTFVDPREAPGSEPTDEPQPFERPILEPVIVRQPAPVGEPLVTIPEAPGFQVDPGLVAGAAVVGGAAVGARVLGGPERKVVPVPGATFG